MVPTILKWDILIWMFLSGFQISDPIQIWSICKLTSFQPFEIQISPDFRSLL